ncbi:hypothetical protein Sjap_019981 [Stephania japonica]|uniref:Uncharacterized protein n=1 Tax=Stephania japonica TaxID=461633 RepID=A0AAP0F2N8_9MAGN
MHKFKSKRDNMKTDKFKNRLIQRSKDRKDKTITCTLFVRDYLGRLWYGIKQTRFSHIYLCCRWIATRAARFTYLVASRGLRRLASRLRDFSQFEFTHWRCLGDSMKYGASLTKINGRLTGSRDLGDVGTLHYTGATHGEGKGMHARTCVRACGPLAGVAGHLRDFIVGDYILFADLGQRAGRLRSRNLTEIDLIKSDPNNVQMSYNFQESLT